MKYILKPTWLIIRGTTMLFFAAFFFILVIALWFIWNFNLKGCWVLDKNNWYGYVENDCYEYPLKKYKHVTFFDMLIGKKTYVNE